VKKKEGFPSVSDKGLADVYLGGEGLSFNLRLATATDKDRQSFFKVDRVDVSIKNLDVRLKKSNHKILFNLFRPLLLKVMRPAIQKAAEIQIRNSFDQLDREVYQVYADAQKTIKAAQESDDPQEAGQMFQSYIQAIQKRLIALKEKQSDTKVNIAASKYSSMFKNINLPNGISTRATKYKDMAKQGDEWRSPIFDIGTAKPTSDLPKPKKITRKSPYKDDQATLNDMHPGNHSNRSSDTNGDGSYPSGDGGLGGDTRNATFIPAYVPPAVVVVDARNAAFQQPSYPPTVDPRAAQFIPTGTQNYQ